jgi:hypothetical protein
MTIVKLKKASEDEYVINFNQDISRGRGYEADVAFIGDGSGGWIAEVIISGMKSQASPEDAADKLSTYLLAMSKAVKAKNIKHLNASEMFASKFKK